jgi:hypothetical protein
MNKFKHNGGNGTTTIIIESPKYGTFNITIDTEDHPKVEGHRWYVTKDYSQKYKDVFYVRSNIYCEAAKSKQRIIIIHRLITNAPKDMQVDHINGNTLDNRQANLRVVTRSKNQHNRAKQGGSSKYHGVREQKSKSKIPGTPSKWIAGIGAKKDKLYLGSYALEESAAEAYDLEVVRTREIINASGQLNFPERLEEYKQQLEGEENNMNKFKHNGNGTTTIIIESPKYGTFNVIIDSEDLSRVGERRWAVAKNFNNKSKDVFYVKSNGKMMAGKREPKIRLHRLITNAPKGMQVDHISGNTLDNRKSNLRVVTNRENAQNRAKQGGASKYKGVWEKKSKTKIPKPSKWEAQTREGGKTKYLGLYTTQEEAAGAYDLAVCRIREIVSPSRQLNFPERLKEYLDIIQLEKNSSES